MSSKPYKVDRDHLPPELLGVTPDQLETEIKSLEKAMNQSFAQQNRKREEHDKLIKDGKALNLIESAKRCYAAGNSGTEQIRGYGWNGHI